MTSICYSVSLLCLYFVVVPEQNGIVVILDILLSFCLARFVSNYWNVQGRNEKGSRWLYLCSFYCSFAPSIELIVFSNRQLESYLSL